MEFKIKTFEASKIPEDLKSIEPTELGSRNLSK